MSLQHYMSLLQDFQVQTNNVPKSISYLGIGLLVTWVLSRYLAPKHGKGIRQLGGFPLFTAWKFFVKRHDFILANFKNDFHFKFNVLQHNIVAVRGEESRKAFFDNRSLNFTEGYKLLLGAAPILKDINIQETEKSDISSFSKNIIKLFSRDRLSDALPILFSDVNRRMESWGKRGQMDPFNTIYDLVFQMTIRMATCAELSDSLKAVEEVQGLYWTLEKNATATALLLPWFPSPARKRKNQATKDLFMKLMSYVEMRRKATVPSSDAIDGLIELGLSTPKIVEFVLATIFAGVVNTGLNSCWALIYLAFHPAWKAKAQAEVDALLQKYTTNFSNEPLHKRLATIPISAWEEEMPVLELVLRETLRLASNGIAFRRNLLEDMTFAGGLVERGDFVTYLSVDVHFDEDIYSSPHKFDPLRFTEGREEDKNATYSFLGWGAGRHFCTGMKVAKLEIKAIVAFLLAGFEFSLVDKHGKPLTELPVRDMNDIHQSRPIGDPCYFKFNRTVE